jgi:hypothetical protein
MFKVRDRGDLSKNTGGFQVKELKLPIVKAAASSQRQLSMDEYHQFVRFNLRHAFNRKAYAKWKKMLVVNVPFSIT